MLWVQTSYCGGGGGGSGDGGGGGGGGGRKAVVCGWREKIVFDSDNDDGDKFTDKVLVGFFFFFNLFSSRLL